MRSFLRLVALLILMASSASLAHAKGASARTLFREAESDYRKGNFLTALALYKEAYEKRPLAGFYINIGQCYRKLLYWKEAIAAYEKYLQLAPKGKHGAKARRLIAVCQEEIKKRGATKPVVEKPATEKPAAEKPATEKPAVPLGGIGSSPEAKPAPIATTSAAATMPPDPVLDTGTEQEPQGRRGLSKITFWSGVGLSAALLVTTAITGAMALSKSDEYKNPETPAADLADLKDSGEALRTTSSVTLALGLVASAGTAALFFFTDWGGGAQEREEQPTEKIALGAAPTLGGAMLSLGGSF